MKIRTCSKITTVALVLSCLPLAGCLERKETITVRPDLSVSIALEYSGTKDELAGPDAIPSEATGWKIERSVRDALNEEKQHIVEATADFAAGAELPGTYAASPGPFLEFPTEVRIEKRDDGDFVRFRRVYRPRAFARFEYWNDRFVTDEIKQLAEKPADKMSVAEREQILSALANVEAHKRLEIANAAAASALPNLRQDARLLARRALLNVFNRIDLQSLAKDLDGLSELERDKRIAVLSETVPVDAENAFVDALTNAADLNSTDVDRLRRALDDENLRYRVTQSTRSHKFRIGLQMPGEIVAHNGDQTKNGGIIWEFDGKAFGDRAFELLATSKLKQD